MRILLLAERGKEGGGVDDVDVDGNTALAFACFKSKPGVVQLLLEGGSNVNAMNHNGHTPLMSACMGPAATGGEGGEGGKEDDEGFQRVEECVRLLLLCKADASLTNREGETALDKASKSAVPRSVLLLLLGNST